MRKLLQEPVELDIVPLEEPITEAADLSIGDGSEDEGDDPLYELYLRMRAEEEGLYDET